MTDMDNAPLRLTGDPEADQLLTDDDNALLIGMVEPKYRRPPTARLRFMPLSAPYVEQLGMVARMATPGYFQIPINGEIERDQLTLRVEEAAIDLLPATNKGKLVMIWFVPMPHVEIATVPLQNARFIIARGIVEPAPVFPIKVNDERASIERQFTRDHKDPVKDIRVQFRVSIKACNPGCQ